MKNAIELRAHILAATAIGTRTYGLTTEPAISIIPDPQFEDGGMCFPAIIGGDVVTYQGIEVVIYDGYEANRYKALLADEAQLDAEISILIKAHDSSANTAITEAAHKIAKGLYILATRTPPIDQAPLLKSIILVVGFTCSQ